MTMVLNHYHTTHN